MILRRFVLTLAVLSLPFSARPTFGYRLGGDLVAFYSGENGVICTGCHFGGSVPTVAFSSGPKSLAPGATSTYTFTVQSTDPSRQVAAGFDVAANGGTFQAIKGQGEQVPTDNPMNVSHTAPKNNNADGLAAWNFKWTAPTAPGFYTLWGAGNSVNLSGTSAATTPRAPHIPLRSEIRRRRAPRHHRRIRQPQRPRRRHRPQPQHAHRREPRRGRTPQRGRQPQRRRPLPPAWTHRRPSRRTRQPWAICPPRRRRRHRLTRPRQRRWPTPRPVTPTATAA
ncbi:MAG: choice-of-anchor V domain-containing protein [Candidatus Binatia bacterium]